MGDQKAYDYVNLILYALLFVLITGALIRQFYFRGFGRPWATQQVFHLYLFWFIVCRMIRTGLGFGGVTSPPARFFFGRNALYFFALSFFVVVIFLSVEVMGASARVQRTSWITLWTLTGLVFCFVISGAIYYSQEPEEYQAEKVFYETSIHLATSLSLICAIGMLIAGLVVAYRLKKADEIISKGPESNHTFRRAFYSMIAVTIVTVVFMLERFIMFLYRPATGELVNEWVFLSMGFWVPEWVLCFVYLIIMRGVQHKGPPQGSHGTPSVVGTGIESRGFLPPETRGESEEDEDEERGGVEEEEVGQGSPSSLSSLPLPPPASAPLPEEEYKITGEVELSVAITLKEKEKNHSRVSPVVGLFTEPPSELSNHASRRKTRNKEEGVVVDRSALLRDEIVEKGEKIELSSVEQLLQSGAEILSVDEEGQNALHLACRFSPLCVISLLLSKIDKNATTFPTPGSHLFPIHYFCSRDFGEISEVGTILASLISLPEEEGEEEEKGGKGKEKEREGGKEKGKESQMLSLVNVPSASGETPLHRVCQFSGDMSVISQLLKNGADPTATTKQGVTPAKMASFANHPNAASLLKKSQKNPVPYPANLKKRKEKGYERKPMANTVSYSSYVERADRDRTEAVLQSPLQTTFFRTMCLRAQPIDRKLYFGVFSIGDDPDNLNTSHYLGATEFTVDDLSDKRGIQTLDAEDCGCLSLSLENVELYSQQGTSITRGYIFPRVDHKTSKSMRVREELEESRFSFIVPSLLLSLISHERQAQSEFLSDFCSNFEQKCSNPGANEPLKPKADLFDGQLQEIKAMKEDEALRSRIRLMAEEHQQHVQQVMQAIDLYTGYHKSFKPSTLKGDTPLAFVPTNLHHQKMKVFPRVDLPHTYSEELGALDGQIQTSNTKPDILEKKKEGEYHITTFGAPAAHTLKFKAGGLRHAEEKFSEKKRHLEGVLNGKKELTAEREMKAFLLNLDAFEAQMHLTRRRDICYCQILPAIITSFVKTLQLNRNKPFVLRQYADVGFLCQFESLVSTHGSEIGMLADYDGAVRGIASRLSFVVCEEGEELSLQFFEKNVERDFLSMGNFSENCLPLKLSQTLYDSCSLQVTLPLPGDLFKDVAPILHQKSIQVHPLLFSQGINEQQSIAMKIGDTSLQEKINRENGVLLKNYSQKYEDWCTQQHVPLNPKISMDLKSILATIKTSKREKNLEILATTADIVRMMDGGRLTSCKSAKDRTSMSVTWEQARLLANHHNLHDDVFREAMSVMRSSGVRRENAFKNIGKNKFAFNSFQLKMIPDIYRAPKGSGGAQVT